MAEIENYSSALEATSVNEFERKASMKNRTQSSEASEMTSSSSLQKENGKGKGLACKRRNPRVLVRRNRANNVDTIGLPLGMSFAAVMAQVLYRRDAAAESMSPSHLSMMCSSAIKESLASVSQASIVDSSLDCSFTTFL
ncbi:CPR-5 isoform X1 [Spatholobus suberectus]|nr:CPR-5 isoform X1 [Spatholobus suberectus]